MAAIAAIWVTMYGTSSASSSATLLSILASTAAILASSRPSTLPSRRSRFAREVAFGRCFFQRLAVLLGALGIDAGAG